MVEKHSESFSLALYDTLKEHNSVMFFWVGGVLCIAWVLFLTEVLQSTELWTFLKNLNLDGPSILMFFGFLNIYYLVSNLNKRDFRRKLFAEANKRGLSRESVETMIVEVETKNMILRGDIHGNLKKNIKRMREK